MRILVISHAHPAFSVGGGENVAYGLFKELDARPDCSAFFLAHRTRPFEDGEGIQFFSYPGTVNETIFESDQFDYFHFSILGGKQGRDVLHQFRLFLEQIRPDVVHFHHYILIGLELIREVHNYSTCVPIILTLHEYLAICTNHGQMVTTNGNELCFLSSPSRCASCFPGKSAQAFVLRELYIKSFFKLVDAFICPSKFLLDRYLEWGLDRDKMILLENGQPLVIPAQACPLEREKERNRFAYFGQINPYKGVDVLLEAMLISQELSDHSMSLSLYASGLDKQTDAFQQRFRQLLAQLGTAVAFHGPYRREDLSGIMRSVDWVVVPSVWWENSPLVIQEAFSYGKPVICSDIGGMAEKVRAYETGLHFRVGDTKHLAERLVEAAKTPGLWKSLSERISPPPAIGEIAQRHISIYENCHRKRQVPAV